MQEQSTVLYRKYRPQSFAEVIGQEHVTGILTRAVKEKNSPHAYLFFGPRGTGKTSVARILASALGAKPVDIFEIDAASNTGVDDIRELREFIKSMPMESPVKVYIIDEVHMLSKSAFNALLKTLEEPPAHVIFILATTEKEKVPETVISRCQSFTFKIPPRDTLKKFILETAKKEGKPLDAPSAELIAMFGGGSFRDTLVVLQKVLSASQKALRPEEVARLIGAPPFELVNAVVEALAEGNIEKGLQAVRAARDENIDMRIYLELILEKLRAVLYLRYAPASKEQFAEDFTPEDLALIERFAADKAKRINSRVLGDLLDVFPRLGFSAIASLPLELALIALIGESKEQEKLL